ncbi:MAG: hypothetical protein IPJ32_16295 [Sphingobacteriaceae bacterium]|nr:hypothetical protein [Sphingobacteriaceae bacterium]
MCNDNMSKPYNESIKNTETEFLNWCLRNGIPIFKINYVVTWEKWDDGIGVYIFTKTNKELKELEGKGLEEIKVEFLEGLRRNNYPFDLFPNVVFEFDTDQNVQENYEGSYFYRLR